MKKAYSRRDFISTSLKGLTGITLFGLIGCSKKNFWETREYKETRKKIYQLADEIYPKDPLSRSNIGMWMIHYDSHQHNPTMIDENGSVSDPINYHPSLHALNKTLTYHEWAKAKIKKGEDPFSVKDFFESPYNKFIK